MEINNLHEMYEFLMSRTQKSVEEKNLEVKFSADEMVCLLEITNKIYHDSIQNGRVLIDVSKKILRNNKIKQDFKDEIFNEIDPVIDFLADI